MTDTHALFCFESFLFWLTLDVKRDIRGVWQGKRDVEKACIAHMNMLGVES